jgi:hypothetical protein
MFVITLPPAGAGGYSFMALSEPWEEKDPNYKKTIFLRKYYICYNIIVMM